MPVIITGLDHVIYQGFTAPTVGAWNMPILGTFPYNYYLIGQTKYNIDPGSISGYPHWELFTAVPFRFIPPIFR
jgi:hypothetical protein